MSIAAEHVSTTPHTATGLIGAPVRRVEDLPLITGAGCFVDDIQVPGVLHMAVLRSPYPKARVISVDTTAARGMTGVEAVLTAEDVDERLNITAAQMVPGMRVPPHPVLARGMVHAVGVPIAVAVASSRALAQDAVNAIRVEYEPLPSVADAEAALAAGAPLARDELESNVCYTVTRDGGEVEAAFAQADQDRKSTRLNSSHIQKSRMPSSA